MGIGAFILSDASHNPRVTVEDEEMRGPDQLRDALERKKDQRPGFVVLCTPSGACLSLGVGGEVASVMYQSETGEPPYVWALGPHQDWDHDVTFLMGGTPTPVPVARTIPFDHMVDIATSWMSTGRLPDNVTWDED